LRCPERDKAQLIVKSTPGNGPATLRNDTAVFGSEKLSRNKKIIKPGNGVRNESTGSAACWAKDIEDL
jgi:hypothetical protein